MTPVPDPIGPVDATKVPRFAGPSTFARLPSIDAVHDFDVAVLGAPFDGGTSYRPGRASAPWPCGRPPGTCGPLTTRSSM